MAEWSMVDPVERKRWGISIATTEELLASPFSMDHLAKEAHREIQRGTPVATLRLDSVRLASKRSDTRLGSYVLDYEWCPEPAHGCEFHGGEAHGQLYAIPRESDGKPPPHFFVQVMPTLYAFEHVKPEPLVGSHKATYLRAGINPETDRWVYEFHAIDAPLDYKGSVKWLYFGPVADATRWARSNRVPAQSVISAVNPHRLHGTRDRIIPVPHPGALPGYLRQDALRAEHIMHRLNFQNGYEKDPDRWL